MTVLERKKREGLSNWVQRDLHPTWGQVGASFIATTVGAQPAPIQSISRVRPLTRAEVPNP
jgi:hypothetical protein